MPPTVVAFYGEPTAIQQVSSAPGANAASIMIVAAIAIPNLLRSRMAANEASAVGSLRTVNTAQVTYATTYPQLGFSRDLASLGSASGAGVPSPAHAGLIDTSLAGPSCTASSWCEKSGYRFRLAACKQTPCRSYVSVAKPASSSTGQRSFCSTEDGVIRTKTVPEPDLPATPSQCRAWQPLH
jgi:type IV pilus assembly protein PilA